MLANEAEARKDETERTYVVPPSRTIMEILDEVETEQDEVKRRKSIKPRPEPRDATVPYTHD